MIAGYRAQSLPNIGRVPREAPPSTFTHSGAASSSWISANDNAIVVFPEPRPEDDPSSRCLLLEMLDQDALDCVLLAVEQESMQVLLARLAQTCKAFRRLSEKVRSDVVLQRLSTRWDPATPNVPTPTGLPSARRFLDALTERSRGQKRVLCYVTRQRGLRAAFNFHVQLESGPNDLPCFTARRHMLGRARGLCYSILLHKKIVAEVWYNSYDGNFYLYEPGMHGDEAPSGDDSSAISCWPGQSRVWPMGSPKKKVQPSLKVSIRRSRIRPRSVHVVIPPSAPIKPASKWPILPVLSALGDKIEQAKPAESACGAEGDGFEFVNLEPRWDEALKHYVLKYYGRATRASVKNVQLQPAPGAYSHPTNFDDVAFLVGKVADDKFNVDFKSPFSFLHAFALSLIIIDSSFFNVV
mmetsp:Transcript_1210/g.3975  ORF Transcript_1210/g.3975 Transcript_1210/m.3975 type:complete len:411 (+) Transcript_1210:120-1352(+)